MSHTPGPWRAKFHTVERDCEDLETFDIATAWPPGRNGTREESWANAKLIAAAPELLEALKKLDAEVEKYAMMKDVGHEGSSLLEAISEARHAIAKAEGQ